MFHTHRVSCLLVQSSRRQLRLCQYGGKDEELLSTIRLRRRGVEYWTRTAWHFFAQEQTLPVCALPVWLLCVSGSSKN